MSTTSTAGRVARRTIVLATVPVAVLLMSGTAFAQGSAQGQTASAGHAAAGQATAQAAQAAHASSNSGANASAAQDSAAVTPAAAPESAAPSADLTAPQPLSNADQNGTGANPGTVEGCGAYCSTRDGSASENGKGDGAAVGKPCAGCVGKADNKNPKGQAPSGPVDHNAGYECDRNQGIGKGNPAHTGCVGDTGGGGGGGTEECPEGQMPTGPGGACETPGGGGGGGGSEECPEGQMPTGPEGACETPGGGGGGGGSVDCPEGQMPTGPDGACETPGGFTGGGGGGGEVVVGGRPGVPALGSGGVTISPDLPFTGDNTGALALGALVVMTAGGGLVLAGRRR